MKIFNKKLTKMASKIEFFLKMIGFFLTKLPPSAKEKPRNILIFDLHLIGDIVILTPFLSALREKHREATITLVAGPWAKEILKGTHFVDQIIEFSAPWVKYRQGIKGIICCIKLIFQLRKTQWDWAIDMRGDVRQIFMLAMTGAKRRISFGFSGGSSLLTDVVPDDGSFSHLMEHHKRIAEYLCFWPQGGLYQPFLKLTKDEECVAKSIPSFIGFHFGASLSLKRIDFNQVQKLLLLFNDCKYPLVIFSVTEIEKDINDLILRLPQSLVKKISVWTGTLRDFIVFSSRARFCFCMDSGPSHILSAFNIETCIFVGPTSSQLVCPISEKAMIVQKLDISCRPCDQMHCTHKEYHYCMKDLINLKVEELAKNLNSEL